MSKKHISIAIILIVLIIILSELHTSRTNQQIQNDRYEAEEKFRYEAEEKFRYEAEEALKNLFKDVPSDDPTIDSINDSKIYYLKCMILADDYRFPRTTRVMVDEGRKYLSNEYLNGNYAEEGNIFFVEEAVEPDGFVANWRFLGLRLNKVSGNLVITTFDPSGADGVLIKTKYQCERAEPVVR